MLHTRGSLHFWAHTYLFACLAALFLEQVVRSRDRVRIVVWLALLGCSIELAQTHLHWQYLELADVASDLMGVGVGLLVSWLRLPSGVRDGGRPRASSMKLVDPVW